MWILSIKGSKDEKIRGYISKTKEVREEKILKNTTLEQERKN